MSSPAEVAKVVQDQLSQYNYIFPRALHVSDNPGDCNARAERNPTWVSGETRWLALIVP